MLKITPRAAPSTRPVNADLASKWQAILANIKKRTVKLIGQTGDTLIPRHCELCQIQSPSPLCAHCLEAIELGSQVPRCQMCDLPLETEAELCGECLIIGHSFDRVISGYIFQNPLNTLINRFKHHNAHHIAKQLCHPLVRRIKSEHDKESLPQLLIPVPIHWSKRLRRGYNQTELLTHELSKHLGIPWQRSVKKIRRTTVQQGLSRKDRLKNLRGSFLCKNLKVQRVAIVDDVFTTGATAEEMGKLVKKQGVQQVDIWVLARTPKGS